MTPSRQRSDQSTNKAEQFPIFTNEEIIRQRPPRNEIDPQKPYAYLVEPEHNASGKVVDVATLFLTNSECPYHCLMCDLWKNTLQRSQPSANVPQQIKFALSELPEGREIKLYNSGNFFDSKAVPLEQYSEIASLVRDFETVIVENHPNLCGDRCLHFRNAIAPAQLEVALGLETCHPELLKSLNKSMTLDDYKRAAAFLLSENIRMRTFILLKPPFLNEEQGIEWTLKSIEFSFDQGVNCCSLVPTRAGNGMMERLEEQGSFTPPMGSSIEHVLAEGIKMKRGRIFIDLWDADRFLECPRCRSARISRLNEMNLKQIVLPEISCDECSS